jgi:hypothetical protein
MRKLDDMRFDKTAQGLAIDLGFAAGAPEEKIIERVLREVAASAIQATKEESERSQHLSSSLGGTGAAAPVHAGEATGCKPGQAVDKTGETAPATQHVEDKNE